MSGTLDDVTVLEIANWVAAPSCAALMADMGADVVKVEPLGGDGMRGKLRQPAAPDGIAAHDLPFQLDNRGKRSIAVDLATPDGAALVQELAASVDVVVTNLLPGRLERYGLGPDDLRAGHPRLIYALVTGYGSDGDDANRVSPVAELPDLVADPQARAIGMFSAVEHAAAGPFDTLAAPFTMSRSEVAVRGRAPEVGEHTAEVLRQFGVDQARVADLRAAGVVGGAP